VGPDSSHVGHVSKDFASCPSSTADGAEPPGLPTPAIARTRKKAMQRAATYFQEGDLASFYETMSTLSFRNMPVSVTLAKPAHPDCPLIGVSQGFEVMTGFHRTEIIGRNCRFLNRGCPMPGHVRHELRTAISGYREFLNILVNRRQDGEVFTNLLLMTSIRIGTDMYILGVQADVTNSDVDLTVESHRRELDAVVEAIFACNVDAWAAIQAANFGAAKIGNIIPYTNLHLLPQYDQRVYAQARAQFVALPVDDIHTGVRSSYSNTFLEVSSGEIPSILLGQLRRVYSEPSLPCTSSHLVDALRVPVAELLHSMCYLQGETGFFGNTGNNADNRKKNMSNELDLEPQLSSEGSRNHPDCTPCSFHCYSQMGCNRGRHCMYCHMEHPKRGRRRGKKLSRGASLAHASDDKNKAEQGHEHTSRLKPVPTPAELMPLLNALEVLAPLPVLGLSSSSTTCSGAWSSRKSQSSSWLSPRDLSSDDDIEMGSLVSPKMLREIEIQYSETSIVLAKSQWKQVLAFVRAPSGRCTFTVQPPLPRGLMLNSETGVISGVACEVTSPSGSFHQVTVETLDGSAATTIHILVVDAGWEMAQVTETSPATNHHYTTVDVTSEEE